MDSFNALMNRLDGTKRRIVFPEGDDPKIREAAIWLARNSPVRPILLRSDMTNALHDEVESLPTEMPDRLEHYTHIFAAQREMPAGAARRLVRPPLGFAAAMTLAGDADGLVAGLSYPTEDVLLAAQMIIGLEPDVLAPSSFFLMTVPGFEGGEDGAVIFADPAVNPDPDAATLASIAVATARSAETILGWTPRVAMLSFSTHGSADHPLADKVAEATGLAHALVPELMIDGELQADAALVPAVACRKMEDLGAVAGRANILIFPDLNAANIGSKLVQRLAGAASLGPVLQGFAKPVSDLSRGATPEDIIGAALMVAIRCKA